MRVCGLLLVIAAGSSPVAPVQAEQADDARLLQLARETIHEARYAALISVDDAGQPRARTVDPFPPDDNFHIWIATRPQTRKVAQIREHAEVTLYYWHAESRSYVTIMGKARLVDDEQTKRAKRREADNDRLYPDFPHDYQLIEITPIWLEAIVPGYRGDNDTWRPASVQFPLREE